MAVTFCSACHQPIAEAREGVRLPALKAHIFDVVRRAGIDGVTIDDINAIVYGDHPASPETIRNHIRQINEALAETSVRIRGLLAPKGLFRIVRSKK